MLPTVLFLSLTTSVVYTTIVAIIPGPKKPDMDFSTINIGKLIANPQVNPTTIFKNKPVANTNFLPNLKSEYSSIMTTCTHSGSCQKSMTEFFLKNN